MRTLSASKVNSTNLLGVAGVKPSSSNCSFVIPRAAADFPDAYKCAPLSFNTLKWSARVPKPTPCISCVVISWRDVTPSPAQKIVTSLPSSIADFATKNPKTERLGFSTPVIICTNNLLHTPILNQRSILSSGYEFSFHDKNKLGALSISLGIFAVVTTINSQTIQLTLWDRDFEKPIAILQWVNLSYLLMAAVSTLLIGRFADLIGRKRMFIYGLLVYGLSTSLLVTVNSFELLIIARGLQALGAQGVVGLSVGLMTTMFGDENRGSAVGLIASIGSVTVLFIPLTIGYLAEYNNWSIIFILPVALSIY